MSQEEKDAKDVRRQKRRQSIQAHKAMLDRKDTEAGLRGKYMENGSDSDTKKADASASATKWVTILAGTGLKDNLGAHGEKSSWNVKSHYPSAICRQFLSHDWKSDRHLRGAMFALRAGTAHLHAEACLNAEKPWQHTQNLTISGGDVNMWWSGWMEGGNCQR